MCWAGVLCYYVDESLQLKFGNSINSIFGQRVWPPSLPDLKSPPSARAFLRGSCFMLLSAACSTCHTREVHSREACTALYHVPGEAH